MNNMDERRIIKADNGMDRRTFLKCLGGGFLATGLGTCGFAEAKKAKEAASQSRNLMIEDELWSKGKPVVVGVNSRGLTRMEEINRRILRDMISSGFMELTKEESFESAVKSLFTKTDIIAFKFNSSHSSVLGTNGALAEELLRMFTETAGFNPDQMIFIEVQPSTVTLPVTRKFKFGWTKEYDFGSGKDQLISVMEEITAIVNVGLLKVNSVAGMSGCMKNLAYGVIKHPARFHGNHCTPYIADIYNLPIIRQKVRVNILNAIRTLLRDQEAITSKVIASTSTLFFSKDPVAIDSSGFELLDKVRTLAKLPPIVKGEDYPHQLLYASKKGLGAYHPDQINYRMVEMD
jgi:hypothetical protein